MEYFIEELYKLTGRDDKVAVVDFIEDSVSFKEYGRGVTVLLVYNQFERAGLEKAFRESKLGQTHGKVPVRLLNGVDFSQEQKDKLAKEGINSKDIKSVFPGWVHDNVFYEEKTREIKIIDVPVRREPKGGDYKWMYGFKKQQVKDGIGLDPHERQWYLAMKKFFEEKHLAEEELNEMQPDGVLRTEIEIKYLEIKLEREVISDEEDKRFTALLHDSVMDNYKILKQAINDAGMSVEKLAETNAGLFRGLLRGTTHFIPRKLNVMGKRAVYLDWSGFLHVFLRHVKEFEIGVQSKDKTKFLWTPDKIVLVMEKVITSIDKEIQTFWEQSPNGRFSKYGKESLYFEGDYYTFHVEPDGRLSTFYMERKKVEL